MPIQGAGDRLLVSTSACVSMTVGLGSSSMFGITGLKAHGVQKWRQGCISSRVFKFQDWVTTPQKQRLRRLRVIYVKYV